MTPYAKRTTYLYLLATIFVLAGSMFVLNTLFLDWIGYILFALAGVIVVFEVLTYAWFGRRMRWRRSTRG